MAEVENVKNDPMAFEALEKLYDVMAETLDEVGVEQHSLFLSKLSMALAHKVGDLKVVEEAIKMAKDGLVTGEEK